MPVINLIFTRPADSTACVSARGGSAAGHCLRTSDQ